MRGPGLIAGYLDALAGQLPGPVVEELADGLEETYRRHLAGNGLHDRAAALDEENVAPAAAMLADAFPDPDDAEPGRPVQGQAGGVLREDAGLDGPDPGGLGGGDQRVQEPAADALAAGSGVDVDGVLDDPGVDAAAGGGRGGHPPGDLARRGRDEPVGGQPGRSEGRPVRRAGLEGRVALLDPGLIDRQEGNATFETRA